MRKFGTRSLALALATPGMAQIATTPAVVDAPPPVTADMPDAATVTLNGAVQARLDANAAKDRQARDAFAAQMAAFNMAQAQFEAAKAKNDAERAAAAAAASEYRQNLAAWRAKTGKVAPPADSAGSAVQTATADDLPKPIVVTARAEPRRVCATETPVGSIMAKRVCRTASETAEQEKRSQQSVDALAAVGFGKLVTAK